MYDEIFKDHVANIQREGRYRNFVDLTRFSNEFPYATNNINGRKITLWCTNDYLGMSCNRQVIKAAKDAIDKNGIGSGGTRNIGGTNNSIVTLERLVADLHNKEKGLVLRLAL